MEANASPNNGDALAFAATRKERILEALGDPVARRILAMLSESAHPAADLLGNGGIPQSTLYRKIHELEQLGLVGIQRTAITPEGKRVDLYRSLLEDLHVDLRGNALRIEVRYRTLSGERLKEMWRAVREETHR